MDPYYLTHKAQEIGYHPEMILAGRRLNDSMSLYVAGEVVKMMTGKRIHVKSSRVLVLGLTFKENCPDLRNSKVIDIIRELEKYGAKVDVLRSLDRCARGEHEYGVKPLKSLGGRQVRRRRAGRRAQRSSRKWASARSASC